jgi:hypothetical protein
MPDSVLTPRLESSNSEAAAVAKTDNRVDLKDLHEKISSIEFWTPTSAPAMTVAAVTLDNGFTVTGQSAAADIKNFDVYLGRKFAVEDAVRKIWAHEGYLLREKMSKEAK